MCSSCSNREKVVDYMPCVNYGNLNLIVDVRKNGVAFVRSNGRYGYFRGEIHPKSSAGDSVILYVMPDLIGPRKFFFRSDEIQQMNEFRKILTSSKMKRAACNYGKLHLDPFEIYDR